MQASADVRSSKRRKLGVSMVTGGLAGFAGSWVVLEYADRRVLGALNASQEIALLVALLYLLMGVGLGVGILSPRLGAKFLNVEDAEELGEERAVLVPSAIGCIALALGLGVVALAGERGIVSPVTALALFIGTMAAAVWMSLKSMRSADEFMRGVMRDGASAGFYLAFGVIGGWALGAHLGFLPQPRMLDVVTLFYALTLVGCFWVVARRGMLVR